MEAKPKHEIDEVIAIARSFLIRNDYSYARLKGVKFDPKRKSWNVKFDVGALLEEIREVEVEDETGKIIGFR